MKTRGLRWIALISPWVLVLPACNRTPPPMPRPPAPPEIVLPVDLAAQDQAVARIKQWGGSFTVDENMSTKPVATVFLNGSKLTNEDLLAITADIPYMKQIDLAGAKNIGPAGMANIKGLTRLQHLNVAFTPIGDDGLIPVADLVDVRHLNLINTGVTDVGLARLKKLTRLEDLYLNGCAITDEGLAHLAGFSELKELTLKGTAITNAGIPHLMGMKKLRVLQATQTKVTTEGTLDLQRAIPELIASSD